MRQARTIQTRGRPGFPWVSARFAVLGVLAVVALLTMFFVRGRLSSDVVAGERAITAPPVPSKESFVPEEARRMIQRAIDDCKRDPTPDRFVTLGLMYHGNGLSWLARDCYEIAIELGADDARTPYLLGLILLEEGEYKAAAPRFRESIERYPNYALAHHHLGYCILNGRMEAIDNAIAAMRRAVHLESDDPVLHTGLGKALRLAGRIDAAEAALRQALYLDADHAGAHQLLGLILHEQGRSDEAGRHLQRMRNYNVTLYNDPWAWEAHRYAASLSAQVNTARELVRFGRPESAAARLTELAQAHPGNAEVHRALGEAYRQAGDHQRAVNAFGRAVELDPSDGGSHVMIAQILLKHEMYEEAEAEATIAFEIDPSLIDALVIRGTAALRQNRVEEAVNTLNGVVQQRPGHFSAAVFLGEALIVQGKLDEATDLLRRAIDSRHGPDTAYAKYQLGIALSQAGKFDEAEVTLRTAAELHPDNEMIESLLASIAEARPQ